MNFPNRFTLFLIFTFLVLSYSVNAQCLESDPSSDISVDMPEPGEWLDKRGYDTTDTKEILNVLEEGSLVESIYSAEFFVEKGYEEATELIVNRYEKIDNKGRLALSLLESLKELKHDNVNALLEEYAEKSFKALPATNLAYKTVVELLFKDRNYSQLDNITEILRKNANSEEGGEGYLYTLTCAFNSPQHQDKIINTLVFVLQNYRDSDTRKMVAYYAKELSESDELKQALREAALNDPAYEVRDLALRSLQNAYHDNSTLDLALKNLRQTTIPEQIENYLNIISSSYTPRSLYIIKDLKDTGSSNIIREKSKEIYSNYWWLYFEPYGKAFDYSLSQTLDSLNAYTKEVASYDWLGDQGFVRELTNRLDNASRHLARGDSSNTAKQIANYQRRLQKVYEKSSKKNSSPRFVTEDGYKFLTKNAEYLLRQLPKQPSYNNKER